MLKASDVFNRFMRHSQAPLGISIPEDVRDAYKALQENEVGRDRSCSGGFLYGGAFQSWHKGQRPRDIDLCITAPELVKALKHAFPPREYLFKYGIFSFDFDSMGPIQDRPVLGDSVQLIGRHQPTGLLIDLLACSNSVDPALFFAHNGSAPIKSCAYDFGSNIYVYDRDFPAHLQASIFAPYDQIDPDMAAKIKRDNLRVAALA